MSKEDKEKLDAGAKEIHAAKAKTEGEAERQARLQAEHAKSLLEDKAKADKAAAKVVKVNGMIVHPLAADFPMLPAKELKELKADIEANGIKFPLLVNKKKDTIIDGRNRYMIAMELGFKGKQIPMDIWEGEEKDVAKEIISRNIMRRHLTTDQRIALVAKLRAPQLEKEAAERQTTSRTTKGAFEGNNEVKGSVAAHIAKETKASQHKAEQALKARKAGLLGEVIAGTRSLKSAAQKGGKKPRVAKDKKVIPFEDVVWAKFKKFMRLFSLDQHREVKRIIHEFTAPRSNKSLK
jgi:ParB-like chromosome segregation protein Spo0J